MTRFAEVLGSLAVTHPFDAVEPDVLPHFAFADIPGPRAVAGRPIVKPLRNLHELPFLQMWWQL